MILQLKVTLKDTKPPVWRRLQVNDSITFYELHQILQIAFEWYDLHLHCFDVRKTNAKQVKFQTWIGINDEEEDFGRFEYEETDQLLKDWFVAEKDKCVYIYDFGDDWEHEIVLEKILEPDQSAIYPRCLKVVGDVPKEDSRGFNEEINNEELKNLINDELQELSSESGGSNPDWPTLFSLAEEFKQLKPWKWMTDDQLFAVYDEVNGEYVYCSIMGAAGQEFGLAAYIGVEGLRFIHKLYSEEIDESFYLEQRSILFSLSDRNELNKEDYEIIKANGLLFRGKKQWPLFRSFKPGFYPWTLDKDEVRLLIVILEQALIVCKRALQDSSFLEAEYGWYFTRDIEIETGDWEDCYISISTEREWSPLLVNELELQKLKKLSNGLNVQIEFDAFMAPTPIQENPGERPYFPYLILCVEREKGLIIHQEMVRVHHFEEDVQQSFVNFIKKVNAIPRAVLVKEDMYHILHAFTDKLDMELIPVKKLPFLEEAKREMFAYFS